MWLRQWCSEFDTCSQSSTSGDAWIKFCIWWLFSSWLASTRVIRPHPHVYSSVQPAALKTKLSCWRRDEMARDSECIYQEAVPEVSLGDVQWLTWSAYHAENQHVTVPPTTISVLLPLFTKSAHSVAMVRHSMDTVKSSVQHLNPGQTPVIAADQPLYAITKTIQWTWPDTYGEDKFSIMFGGLHIEMCILKVCYECKVFFFVFVHI